MWVVLPVKRLQSAKHRLSNCLSKAQRATLSLMMLQDLLATLLASKVVQGVTMITSDAALPAVAREYHAECQLTEVDEGYSEDARRAIEQISERRIDRIAVIPGDVPLLGKHDMTMLNDRHKQGMTLCPAQADGGTNGLLFSTPLQIPLLFGLNSLENHVNQADESGIPCQVVEIAGLARDVDVPADIAWLLKQKVANRTTHYLNSLAITDVLQGMEI